MKPDELPLLTFRCTGCARIIQAKYHPLPMRDRLGHECRFVQVGKEGRDGERIKQADLFGDC